MNGLGGRVRDSQNCGVWDTVREVRRPAIGSYWDSSYSTAPAVHGATHVMLRSRNDNILPRFDRRSLQTPSSIAPVMIQLGTTVCRLHTFMKRSPSF